MRARKGFTLLELMIASAVLSIILAAMLNLKVRDIRASFAVSLASFLVAVDKGFADAIALYGDYPPLYSPNTPTYIGPMTAQVLTRPFTDTWTWVPYERRREIPRNILDPRVNLLKLDDYEFYLFYVPSTGDLINVFELAIYRRGTQPLGKVDREILKTKLGNKFCIADDGSGRYFLSSGRYNTDSAGNCRGVQQEGYYTIKRR